MIKNKALLLISLIINLFFTSEIIAGDTQAEVNDRKAARRARRAVKRSEPTVSPVVAGLEQHQHGDPSKLRRPMHWSEIIETTEKAVAINTFAPIISTGAEIATKATTGKFPRECTGGMPINRACVAFKGARFSGIDDPVTGAILHLQHSATSSSDPLVEALHQDNVGMSLAFTGDIRRQKSWVLMFPHSSGDTCKDMSFVVPIVQAGYGVAYLPPEAIGYLRVAQDQFGNDSAHDIVNGVIAIRLLHELSGKKVHLMGTSRGGKSVIDLMITQPHKDERDGTNVMGMIGSYAALYAPYPVQHLLEVYKKLPKNIPGVVFAADLDEYCFSKVLGDMLRNLNREKIVTLEEKNVSTAETTELSGLLAEYRRRLMRGQDTTAVRTRIARHPCMRISKQITLFNMLDAGHGYMSWRTDDAAILCVDSEEVNGATMTLEHHFSEMCEWPLDKDASEVRVRMHDSPDGPRDAETLKQQKGKFIKKHRPTFDRLLKKHAKALQAIKINIKGKEVSVYQSIQAQLAKGKTDIIIPRAVYRGFFQGSNIPALYFDKKSFDATVLIYTTLLNKLSS